ncbi:MAG: hypothetical protein H6839_04505 [Planctomycetes bacterium]|nr:hypothetical protein [Planctomycetota bacterium]
MRNLACILPLLLLLLSGCGGQTGNGADPANQVSCGAGHPEPEHPKRLDIAVPAGLQDILENPDSASLATLAADSEFKLHKELKGIDPASLELVGEYRVIDGATLDEHHLRVLVESFKKAFFAGEMEGMLCFEPHHALRLRKDSRHLDILICFYCHNYKVLPYGGYNNVVLDMDTGIENTWRTLVARYRLLDISGTDSD